MTLFKTLLEQQRKSIDIFDSKITHLNQLAVPFDRIHYGDVYIDCMNLESLEGFPEIVDGSVFITSKKLKNLVGCSQSCHNFDISHCTSLTSLKGGPREVHGFYEIGNLPNLSSLDYLPKIIDSHIYLTNSEQCHKDLYKLCFITLTYNLTIGNNKPVFISNNSALEAIVNKYVLLGKNGALKLQNELIDMGYDS